MEELKKCLIPLFITEYYEESGTVWTLGWGINQGQEVEVTEEFAKEFLDIQQRQLGIERFKTIKIE